MSLLHLAAVLDDGGAMAAHLLRTQPWAAWSWLCLGWRAPGLPAPPPTANGHHAALSNGNGNGVVATDGAEGNGPEEKGDEQEEEGDAEEQDEEEVLLPAPALTPGSLSMLLGKEAALRLAVSMVQKPKQRQQQQGDGATAALLGALEEWGRSGATLLAALCEQFARQGL